MKFRKGDKVLIARANDKPWHGIYIKLDKPSSFSRAYGRQAIVDIGSGFGLAKVGTITVAVADLRLDKSQNPGDGEEKGDDMCDMCMSSGVHVDRTTYCGQTIGRECGCDDAYADATCDDKDCEACKSHRSKKKNPDDEDEIMEEEDDFDLKGEMEEGGVISDRTRGGYSVSLSHKYIGEFNDYDKALKFLVQTMEDEKWYPNIFFVNDHGNVDLIGVRPKTIKGKVISVKSEIIRSWV